MHPALLLPSLAAATRRACAPLVLLAACAEPPRPTDTGAPRDATDVAIDVAPDVRDVVDVAPPYDAGAPPACAVTASARRVLDRPGGDRALDPGALVAITGGYLVGLRRVDLAPPDAGAGDGGALPRTRDSIDVVALGEDGAPRGPAAVVYDGAPAGTATDGPALFAAAGGGAYAVFQESRNIASDPGFVLRLRGAAIDPSGAPGASRVLRERQPRGEMDRLRGGDLLGVTVRFGDVNDAGIVAATPVSMLLRGDGTDARGDVNINSFVPFEALDPRLRATDGGGAVFVFRTGGRLGILRFGADGGIDGHGVYEVRGAAAAPQLDDAAAAGDGVVFAWTRNAGARAEVHVVVASERGMLRLDRELEAFMGEGPTSATVVPAYGGAAVLWRRGVDANARVRVAVVAPDGVVRVEPRDLVAAPGLEGRVVAVAQGRLVAFVARQGAAPAWGYVFGRACLPGP